MNPTTYLYLDLRLKMSEVRPLLHLYVFSMCSEAVLFICIMLLSLPQASIFQALLVVMVMIDNYIV
jgi:hypothetical protein